MSETPRSAKDDFAAQVAYTRELTEKFKANALANAEALPNQVMATAARRMDMRLTKARQGHVFCDPGQRSLYLRLANDAIRDYAKTAELWGAP